jgi:hypothetical protein
MFIAHRSLFYNTQISPISFSEEAWQPDLKPSKPREKK